ncbi:type VII secretion-associated serine protease mycosin [Mycobacterium hubeiense]|uniref:type VII secretion-associated serine protease mycosin n=1 Tax=Mycobacterium hubeiense TaxID=1867256 RepID=UPI001E64C822|nr:type VII secretion-associated serine protease mycosin [Mycobacterium sp. QGD 101]
MTNRLMHCAAVALTMLPMLAAPPASAVVPPPVDDLLLPKPGPAAPPQPTEQFEPCFSSAPGTKVTGAVDEELTTVWQLTRGSGQTVAVIDTGVTRHRMLPRLVGGGDYVSSGDGTEDCDGHGTIVAGIVGAASTEGSDGFGGVAPDATIMSIRQSSNKFRAANPASVSGFGDVNTLAQAVRTAADSGATVINVSSVACLRVADALDDRALGAALAYAVDVKNVVVVAAAGNVGGPGRCPEQNPAAPGQPNWDAVRVVVSPPWYDDLVLTVGSVGPDGEPSGFTLAGPWVDVAARGEGIVSLDPDGEGLIDRLPESGGTTPISGTSYAAPVVAGVAALVRSRWPHLTARQVMARIEDTAQRPPSGWDPFVGHGVIDAVAAVSGDPGAGGSYARVTPRPVSTSVAAPDTRPVGFVFSAAAICVGVVVTATALTGRLRRR